MRMILRKVSDFFNILELFFLVPRVRLELTRNNNVSAGFKPTASTNSATPAKITFNRLHEFNKVVNPLLN